MKIISFRQTCLIFNERNYADFTEYFIYTPKQGLLFSEINLVVNIHDKIALIGHNGVGKSTLLKIISGELQPSSGQINLKPKRIIFRRFSDNSII